MSDTLFRINPDTIAPELFADRDAVMAPGLFGAINSTRSAIESHGFTEAFDLVEFTHISWPGGTLAETGVIRANGKFQLDGNPDLPYAYDLGYPELIHPRALVDAEGNPTLILGLTDMIRFAIEKDASLAIISPTIRYNDDPARGGAVFKTFLQGLFVEGRWNDGALPREIVFEIGNENYDTLAYANDVVAQLQAVREFRTEHPDVRFKVAVQAGQDEVATRELIAEMDRISGPEHLMAEADMVRVHDLKHSLTILKDFEHGGKATALNDMALHILDERAALGLDDRPEVEFYLSAWTATSRDVDPELSAGLPSAGAVLSFFTGLGELGVDLAAAWGVGLDNRDGSPSTVAWHVKETHATFVTPKGAVLRQMAETLPGMSVVQHPGMDAGRFWPATLHAYSDDAKVVMFVAANDLPDDSHQVTIALPDMGAYSNIWAESINVSEGIAGDPVLANPGLAIGPDGISLTLTRDYEIVRIIANRADPGSDPLFLMAGREGGALFGQGGDDRILGGPGQDMLEGRAGHDRLYGLGGHDSLAGGVGNDTLSGDDGDDTLSGGDGDDRLFAGSDADSLSGGAGDDRLQSGPGAGGVLTGGAGADLFMVDPAGQTVVTDFDPAGGDLLGFGGLYTEFEDFRAAITAVDHTGSGTARDMAIGHAGLGTTVILGGMLLQDQMLAALLDLPAVATAHAAQSARLEDPNDPDQLAEGTPAPNIGQRAEDTREDDEDDEVEDAGTAGTGGGSCFVATAAWGDRLAPDVVWLRRYRDRVLVRSAAGRAFIRAYWRIGPRLARHVRPDQPSGLLARALIRCIIACLRRISPG